MSSPIVIKKYANRRLYNTQTSVYVTLEDLAQMVKREEDFVVQDAKTGEDLTRGVLTQIIFELENKGEQNMLPIPFLRQLIRFYGDSLQALVPGFLDMSLQNFVKEQEHWRDQMSKAFGLPFNAFEDQVKQNAKLFEQTFAMFSPFSLQPMASQSAQQPAAAQPSSRDAEMERLHAQISAMQAALDKVTKNSAG